MRKIKLTCLGLLFCSLILTSKGQVDPTQWLLEQVSLGEANYDDSLVEQSLHRLESIDPNNPEVIAANLRLALRQNHQKQAQQALEKLQQVAPNSNIYQQAQLSMALAKPETQQTLQQARILAKAGQTAEAKVQYDKLFHGVEPPTLNLATEYWLLMARTPGQEQTALPHLQTLNTRWQKQTATENNNNANQMFVLLKKALSRQLITQGDQALKANNLSLAQKSYQQSYELDNTYSPSLVGLGDVALAQHNNRAAEQAYKRAYDIDQRTSAAYGLLHIYRDESPQKALAYANSLPKDLQIEMRERIQSLKGDALQQELTQLIAEKRWSQAIATYHKAHKADPTDVWPAYKLASALQQAGQSDEADALMRQLATQQPHNPQQVYVYALYLSNTDREQQALVHLKTLPTRLWDKNMRELAQRLLTQLELAHANKLRDSGNEAAAIVYLSLLAQTTDIELTLADWAMQRGDYRSALIYYQRVRAREPQNPDARVGEIEALVGEKQLDKARQKLRAQERMQASLSLNMQRRVANAWFAVGEPNKANAIFQQLKLKALNEAPSQDNALLFRDAARLEQIQHQPKLATADYRRAMVASGITPTLPVDDGFYTRLMRNTPSDDWLKRGIRSDAADLYRQQNVNVTIDQDLWQSKGTGGTSDLNAYDTMLQVDIPAYDGRAFFRADMVWLNAGSFTTTEEGINDATFGTCATFTCFGSDPQHQYGTSLAVGWADARWAMDIGTTPLGFDIVNVVGGVSYSSRLANIGWTLTASRRPMYNSLLSFAGTVDPYTGITWGGVVATGLDLSVSYDRGNANGYWGDINADVLTGKNVESNQGIIFMHGVYHKFINEENRRLSVGLSNMIWHYQNNLDSYSLGQGGYYSPQFYLSFGIPIDYRRRTENWSYELGGSVSWSTATTNGEQLYPIPSLIPNLPAGANTTSAGSSGSGFGFTLLALVERRLTSHLFLGAGVDIQRANDYQPSHALMYLRYTLDKWEGDLDLPPRPLIPYAYFR